MPLADLQIPFFNAESALILHDDDYVLYVHDQIQRARERIEVSMFVADVRPEQDVHRVVRGLLQALAEAAWRGVEVRVLFSPFVTATPPLDVNRVARRFLAARGVAVRTYQTPPESQRKSLHTKLLIFDRKCCVTGSHNWTGGALSYNIETSIAVESTDLARRMAMTFESHWRRGEAVLESI